MKKQLSKPLAWLAFALLSFATYAQPTVLQGKAARQLVPHTDCIRRENKAILPSYLHFNADFSATKPEISPYLQQTFRLSAAYSWQFQHKKTDNLGYTHHTFQQSYQNFPVEGGIYHLHTQADKWTALSGNSFEIGEKLPYRPAISPKKAKEKMLAYKQVKTLHKALTQAELLWVPQKGDYKKADFRLAYRFEVYAAQPFSHTYIYVDAQTGEIVWERELMCEEDVPGTAVTQYSGQQAIVADSYNGFFRLKDAARNVHTKNLQSMSDSTQAVDFTDDDNYWNNFNAQKDEVATDVHWGAEMTFDYFKNKQNHIGIDGNGKAIHAYVHTEFNLANAFWDGDAVYFGDGDGGQFLPFTCIEIVGHEITHGVTQFSAGLIYQDESGGLNESFSDIFGTIVEYINTPTNFSWGIGDNIGTQFRSMSYPKAFQCADTYGGLYWNNPEVHHSSGVQNHWFYILAHGKVGINDLGTHYDVAGIGVEKAGAIAFRNLSTYLTPSSTYHDARFYAIQAATDLYGGCSPEVEAVVNAWNAVGLGEKYVPYTVADFEADKQQICSPALPVTFSNLSINGNTFVWNFGDGSSSTENNPVHTYSNEGTYTLSLQAEGGVCGQDEVIKTNYISINAAFPCEFSIPVKSAQMTTLCKGTLYDSGGKDTTYFYPNRGFFTIASPNAGQLILTFEELWYKQGYGKIIIYDGLDTLGTVLAEYEGTFPPPPLTTPNGSVTIEERTFYWDGFNGGIKMNWECFTPTQPPITDFEVKNTDCNANVIFQDKSINGAQAWHWDFGDGTTSDERSPTHQYWQSGVYTVSLTVSNSIGSDTETKQGIVIIDIPTLPQVDTLWTVCGVGTTTLHGTAPDKLIWLNADKKIVGEGNTFIAPAIQEPTRFFAANQKATLNTGGRMVDNNASLYDYWGGIYFEVLKPCTLKTVKVKAYYSTTLVIQLYGGDQVIQKSFPLDAGINILTLDFLLAKGSLYALRNESNSELLYEYTNVNDHFPYYIGDAVTLISGVNSNSSYEFFYEWEVESGCMSALIPLTVRPDPSADFGYTTTLSQVAFQNTSKGSTDTWYWDFGDGEQSEEENPVHIYEKKGHYKVTFTVKKGDCINVTSKDLYIKDISAFELDAGSMNLYPNPSDGVGILAIQLKEEQEISGFICNHLGQKVREIPLITTQNFKYAFDLSSYGAGVYTVCVKIGSNWIRKPIVIY